MAEEIVACPGCAKKFKIPDGAPPGSFACTACGADVPYGAAAAAAAGGSKGRSKSARGGRGAGRRAAAKKRVAAGRAAEPEPDSAQAGGRRRRGSAKADGRAARKAGRRGAAADAPAEKENKTVPLLIAIGGFVLVAFIVVAAVMQDDPPPDAPPPTGLPETPVSGLSSDGTGMPLPTGGTAVPVAPVAPPVIPVTPEPPPVEDSGIEGTETRDRVKDYRHYFNRPTEELFVELPALEGTTDEEAETFRSDVRLFIDFDSGRDGMDAQHRIEKAGRKAIPFLLSGFVTQYNGKKWEDPKEQWAAFQIQQLVARMTKADGPPSTFIARYSPGVDVPAKHFERAGRMWIAWWLGEGQHIETFTEHSDEME